MTTSEVAEALCVSVFSVRSMVKDGVLPSIRYRRRGRLRFRRSDVEALLRRRTPGGEDT